MAKPIDDRNYLHLFECSAGHQCTVDIAREDRCGHDVDGIACGKPLKLVSCPGCGGSR